MPMPGVDLTTAQTPSDYSHAQIETAARVAWMLQRGTFVLCVTPACAAACETCSVRLLGRDVCPDCGAPQNDDA